MTRNAATPDTLTRLRTRLAQLERGTAGHDRLPFDPGFCEPDSPQGIGLDRGALHEIFAGAPDDRGAATGFAAILAGRAAAGRPVLWVRQPARSPYAGRLYGPGLLACGLDPARLILVELTEAADMLRAGLEAARCRALGAIIVEPRGEPKALDFTASRRLALAASQSGVTLFALRIDARPRHSTARTRWQVAAGASTPLAANAPGDAAFDITLLRHRAGPAGHTWHLEWDHDRSVFRPPQQPAPLPRPVVSPPHRRPSPPARRPAVGGDRHIVPLAGAQ